MTERKEVVGGEELTVVRTEPMRMVTTVDVRDASPEGVALMRQRVEAQEEMLKIAISLTRPSQWTIFAGGGKETIYPTGGAADTILRRAFGLTWGEKVVAVYENNRGDLEASCTAWLMDGDRKVEQFVGYRVMGGYVKTEPDLKRSVVENMKSVAVRDLLGLRFRTPDELQSMGLNVRGIKTRAEFRDHGSDDSGPVLIPFGKGYKGKPVTVLSDTQLVWYTDRANENIANPAKAKWRAKESKWLQTLQEEQASRARTEPEPEPKPETPEEEKTPSQVADELPDFEA